MKLLLLLALLGTCAHGKPNTPKKISVTNSSFNQVYAPGDLIFADEFDTLNYGLWQWEVNMNGGGVSEESCILLYTTNQ